MTVLYWSYFSSKFPDIHPITLLHGFTLYSWRALWSTFHKFFCQQNFRIRLYFGFYSCYDKKIQDIFQTVFNPKGAYHHDYPEMKRRKRTGLLNAKGGWAIGVPLGFSLKIFSGETSCPLCNAAGAGTGLGNRPPPRASALSTEPPPPTWPKQGWLPWRITMPFRGLPNRGWLTASFTTWLRLLPPHQLIAGIIYNQLFNTSPVSTATASMISLSMCSLTVTTRPWSNRDVIVVCDRNKVIKRCVYGAPDFVLEVLSLPPRRTWSSSWTSTWMPVYGNTGWSTRTRGRLHLRFEHEDYPLICGFEDNVTVSILDSQCQIDFRKMYNFISFLYED